MTPTRTAAAMRAAPQIRKKLIDSFLTRDETIAAIIDAEFAEVVEALRGAVKMLRRVWDADGGLGEYPDDEDIADVLRACGEEVEGG